MTRMVRSFDVLEKKARLIGFDQAEFATQDTFETDDKNDNDENIEFGYVLDDFKVAKQYALDHPNAFPYTLVDSDGGLIIIDGWHFVNRIGYLFGLNKVENVEAKW